MYTLNEQRVKTFHLTGRDVRVLIGTNQLKSHNMVMGVCEVPPHSVMDPHAHELEEEVMYVIQGNGRAIVDGAEESITADTAICMPPGSSHQIANDGDTILKFVFVFSPKISLDYYET